MRRVMCSLTCSYSAIAGAASERATPGRAEAWRVVAEPDFMSVLGGSHGLGADLFGQPGLEFHELGRGLDRVVARVRQIDRDLGLDAAGPRAEHGHAAGHEDGLV